MKITPEEEAEWARIQAQESQKSRSPTTQREPAAEARGLQSQRASLGSEDPTPEPNSSAEGESARTELPDEPEPLPFEDEDTVMEDAPVEPMGTTESVLAGPDEQPSCEPSLPSLPQIQQATPPKFLGPFPPRADRTEGQAWEMVNELLNIAMSSPLAWEILVGYYFQEGRNPGAYLGHGCEALLWEPNLLLQDRQEHNPEMFPGPYLVPNDLDGDRLQTIARCIMDGNEDLFTFAIRTWQLGLKGGEPNALENILLRAGWCFNVEGSPEWNTVAMVKRMAPGQQRDALLLSAFQELPRFTKRCWEDPRCW